MAEINRAVPDWVMTGCRYMLYRDEISHHDTSIHIMILVYTLSKTILGHSFFSYILVSTIVMEKVQNARKMACVYIWWCDQTLAL